MRYLAPLLLLFALSGSAQVLAVEGPPQQVPEFSGIDHWINSPPLTMAGLRGKVVLIDFWAYSCINCFRAIPHVEHLYATYGDKGLVVVGVHTPEFDFEKNPANVLAAVQHLGITYPVAMDSGNATWSAWHNQFWPAEYLIDQSGKLIGYHYGEGDYVKMENAIRLLLGLNTLPSDAGSSNFVPGANDTPELHLGSANQLGFGNPEGGENGTRHFTAPGSLALNRFALIGLWGITDQYAGLVGTQGDLDLRFKAAKLYMVASADHPVSVEVTIDGKAQPSITIEGSRLYTLFDSHDDQEHTLALHIPQKGLRVYSFTFG